MAKRMFQSIWCKLGYHDWPEKWISTVKKFTIHGITRGMCVVRTQTCQHCPVTRETKELL